MDSYTVQNVVRVYLELTEHAIVMQMVKECLVQIGLVKNDAKGWLYAQNHKLKKVLDNKNVK